MFILRVSVFSRLVYFPCVCCCRHVHWPCFIACIICVFAGLRYANFSCLYYLQKCLFSVYGMLPDMSVFQVYAVCRHLNFPCVGYLRTCSFSAFPLLVVFLLHDCTSAKWIVLVKLLYVLKYVLLFSNANDYRVYQFKNVCLVHLSLACLIWHTFLSAC